MAVRRDLRIESLDDVMLEVDRLVLGHETTGNWSLGQTLYHLATAIRLITAPQPDIPVTEAEEDRKFSVRRRRFFGRGFPDHAPIPLEVMIPPEAVEVQSEAESLRLAIARFEEHTGPFPPHPVLGMLSKDEWALFHKLHCIHHLSFVHQVSTDPPEGKLS